MKIDHKTKKVLEIATEQIGWCSGCDTASELKDGYCKKCWSDAVDHEKPK